MLTLKTSAMKYKSSDGSMQDVNAIIGKEVTDLTLTKTGIAADAKVVGEKITTIENNLNNYYLKSEADSLHTEILGYVDTEVAALVNSAPETLDTLGELASAFEENPDMVETLNEAITFKANQSDLDKFKTETWTFTLSNGSTVTKQVVIK